MIRVLLESPYAGEIVLNCVYARDAMRDCLMRGEAPFASHLLYTQPGVLEDDLPHERTLGIEAGLVWGMQAEKTVVYLDRGLSKGMLYGIERAKSQSRPIEYRRLFNWFQSDAIEAIRSVSRRTDEYANWGHLARIGFDDQEISLIFVALQTRFEVNLDRDSFWSFFTRDDPFEKLAKWVFDEVQKMDAQR